MPKSLPHLRSWRRALTLATSSLTLVGLIALSSSAGAGTVGAWQSAVAVPGLAALNTAGSGDLFGISCASTGNCAAVGDYTTTGGAYHAYVADETNGSWGSAIEVPGVAALNVGGGAGADSISCTSAGNCTLGGVYTDAAGSKQVFVASEVNGTWQNATELPGSSALTGGQYAWMDGLVCTSVGNCVGAGYYTDPAKKQQAFVVSQVNGTWGTMTEVPGTAGLNSGGQAEAYTVACSTSGTCVVGGYYADASNKLQAFIITAVNGAWGSAVAPPGVAALNAGGDAGVFALSCPSANGCTGGGRYKDAAGHEQAFVIDQVNGTWRSAVPLPGAQALNVGGRAGEMSIACSAAGSCSSGGYYTGSVGGYQAFVADEVNGVWHSAVEVAGSGALNAGNDGYVNSVACSAVGECAAGGSYKDGAGKYQSFVVIETGGVWQSAIETPGTAALNTAGTAGVNALSCAPSGYCAVGGYYDSATSQYQAYVANANAGPSSGPTTTTTKPPVKKHTITCVRAKKLRHVTAVKPRCPLGWRLKRA